MKLLSKIVFLAKRVFCLAFNRHEWEERTLIQWCVKCLWLQRKDPVRGWIFFSDDTYDDSWMTPQQEKTISEELFEYVELENR